MHFSISTAVCLFFLLFIIGNQCAGSEKLQIELLVARDVGLASNNRFFTTGLQYCAL